MIDDLHRIDFHLGQVTAAVSGDIEGVEALKELLIAGGSHFGVFRGMPREERPLGRVSSSILGAYRLLHEWETIADSVLRLVGDQRWRPTGREIDRLMEVLDAKSTLQELVTKTGVSLCAVVDELVEAKRMGLVVEAVPAPPPAPVPTIVETAEQASAKDGAEERQVQPASARADAFAGVDFDELLDRARSSTKRGDHGLAEASLEAALELRPGDRIAGQNLRRVRHLMSLTRVKGL